MAVQMTLVVQREGTTHRTNQFWRLNSDLPLVSPSSFQQRRTVHKVALHPLIWDLPCLLASLPFCHNKYKKKILLINARCSSANYQMILNFEILSFKFVTRFLTCVEPYMQHQLSTPFQIYEEGMHVIN